MQLKLQTIKPGDNKTYPKDGDRITLHYTVSFQDDTKIDSTRDRNYPFAFYIGKNQVIKGWEQTLLKMSLGQRAILTCPHDYAYGANGIAGIIPGNSTLKFDIQILRIG